MDPYILTADRLRRMSDRSLWRIFQEAFPQGCASTSDMYGWIIRRDYNDGWFDLLLHINDVQSNRNYYPEWFAARAAEMHTIHGVTPNPSWHTRDSRGTRISHITRDWSGMFMGPEYGNRRNALSTLLIDYLWDYIDAHRNALPS